MMMMMILEFQLTQPPFLTYGKLPRWYQSWKKIMKLGWEWVETDPGPFIAPYSDFQQCLLDPTKHKPTDFFNALFENQKYTIMAEQTNLYARWWI